MAGRSVARKLIDAHLLSGQPEPGREVVLKIDQTLTQDATGTAVMLELEAMGLRRARTECSVQYVDHNLFAADHRNPDDQEFLRTAAARYGLWFSPAGNGVSHPLHQQHFGIPGKSLLGSDSHTPAAGALGMLAFGSGGIEVALAIAGQPAHLPMPEIWGIELVGDLPAWVSAKDVVLEMLRRHGVDGGVGTIIEYHGPGVRRLSAMDRHVIANMGTELGATSTVFPADDEIERYLTAQGRARDFVRLEPDRDAVYDRSDRIDLSRVEPLIAMPSSPGNVRPVAAVEGTPIGQAYIGSSANPGFRDFAIAAEIVAGKRTDPSVSFDINPSTRAILADLARSGHLELLVEAGARIHQAGCNGCIGMGQAPATEAFSLRTVPRNFAGRSGTREDKVCLVSPETAAVSALRGAITDPRRIGERLPEIREPGRTISLRTFVAPLPEDAAAAVQIRKGPNIVPLPELDAMPKRMRVEILLRVADDISTDEIMPAGSRILPFRSNIPKISEFAFEAVAPDYAATAAERRDGGVEHAIVGGRNYGQGSSREHAALAPRFLGLRCVLARSFARIHRQNLIAHGVLPLIVDASTDERLAVGETLVFEDVADQLRNGERIRGAVGTDHGEFFAAHDLSSREVDVIVAGGLIRHTARQLAV